MAARPATPDALRRRAGTAACASLRNGTLVARAGHRLSATAVSQDGGEQGLLGIAFSPDGTQLYVALHDTGGDTQVDEYAMQRRDRRSRDPRRDPARVDQPQPNHNGGQLAFGPDG